MRAIWNGATLARSDDTVVVDGERNADAAWFYPEPMEGAEMVTDRVAFWHGVEVVE